MRTLTALILSLTITLAVFQALYPQPSKYEGKPVKKILFEGLKNANEDDLLYVMKTTAGYPLKAVEIREDIRKIFKKGNFESIVVEVEEYKDGVRVKFVCRERPVIKEIRYKGIDKVSESDLTSAIPIKEGGIIPLAAEDNPRALEVRHYGKAPGSFLLYDDDGESFAYEQGEHTWLQLRAEVDAGGRLTGTVDAVGPGLSQSWDEFRWVWMS